MSKVIAIVLGTRPEIIKLAPVISSLKNSGKFSTKIIFTGQHLSMAEQAFSVFGIVPDIDFKIMSANQTPTGVLGALLPMLENYLQSISPVGVIVQGDTTSALAGALAAFHLKLPVAHVEAGLRTNDLLSPFPEEMNRTLISKIASLHFCPTSRAMNNLKAEGISKNVFITGNTVIDALKHVDSLLEANKLQLTPKVKEIGENSKNFILVTGHRRENFDGQLHSLCRSLKQILEQHKSIEIVYPVHLNPNVQNTVHSTLGNTSRIHLLEPVSYHELIYLLKRASLVITDSGGIQEEAPSFGKRVLVTRNHTERPEAIEANFARLVSLDDASDLTQIALSELGHLENQYQVLSMKNPFGDGTASEQIESLLKQHWLNIAIAN